MIKIQNSLVQYQIFMKALHYKMQICIKQEIQYKWDVLLAYYLLCSSTCLLLLNDLVF